MQLTKEQYVFIQSSNRATGDVYDFEVNIPDGMLACDQDEVMAVTLMNFDMPYTWYTVNASNNTFVFENTVKHQNTMISLPFGNYNYKKLADEINVMYPDVYCEYLRPQNKLRFTFSENHVLHFQGTSHAVLGFNNNDVPTGTVIESTQQLSTGNTITEICVKVWGLSPYREAFNIDTIAGNVQVSNILLAIPFSTTPFGMLSFVNLTNTNTMYVQNKKIGSIRFTITDFHDNILTFISEFSMTLQIRTFREDTNSKDLCDRLDTMIQMNRLSLMKSYVAG